MLELLRITVDQFCREMYMAPSGEFFYLDSITGDVTFEDPSQLRLVDEEFPDAESSSLNEVEIIAPLNYQN